MSRNMFYRFKKLILIPLLFGVTVVNGQSKDEISIPIETLADSMSVRSKPMLILISTDWCKFCLIQKAQLKKNKDFKSASNKFYYAELNAESRDSITFNDKIYRYKSTGGSTGIHELAIELGNQKGGVSYPTWVLLDQQYQILLRHSGMLNTRELRLILNTIEEMTR